MKHTVIFQGKKYISSKRASKVSDYSSDYIGQLCRAGKLDGKMFGHTWFITEESLIAHQAISASAESFKNRALNFKKLSSSKTGVDEDTSSDEVGRISARRAAEMSGYSADYIGQLCRSGKLDAKMIGHTWFVTEQSVFAHMRKIEQEQREAEFRKLSRQSPVSTKSSKAVLSPYPTVSRSTLRAAAQGEKISHPIRTSVLTLAFIVVFIFVASMTISYIGGAGNVAVNNSSVAGVYSTAQAIVAFFEQQYEAVVARIIKSRDLTVRTVDPISVHGTEYGMVVAPSTGDAAQDAARTELLRNTFSDDVAVHPDQSGTAGVITPVFRKSNGKDFMYVLVPVKSGDKTNGSSP